MDGAVMALIPLKHSVTVTPKGVEDKWGNSTPGTPYSLRCRAEETTERVRNQYGEEVVSTLKLTFDKLPAIKYDDTIEYTNEIGVTVKQEPASISTVRMINGKAALTLVYLADSAKPR